MLQFWNRFETFLIQRRDKSVCQYLVIRFNLLSQKLNVLHVDNKINLIRNNLGITEKAKLGVGKS